MAYLKEAMSTTELVEIIREVEQNGEDEYAGKISDDHHHWLRKSTKLRTQHVRDKSMTLALGSVVK